ncbi:MAG: LysR family transcriptional regulator [Pygmaiobacter sp.]
MELMQLYYFQIVAKNQHITRSAEELNVSQPAISTVIARLESELGVSLFDRRNRTIVLNDYGRAFLKRVNTILMEVENSKQELKDMSQHADDMVSLAVTSPQFLQGTEEFMRENPRIRWQQSVHEVDEIAQMLQQGSIDLAVTSPGIYRDNLVSTVLLCDEFMIAVHPDNPLAAKETVSPSELATQKFILLQKALPFRTQTDLLFQDLGIAPEVFMECDHYMRREMLNANAGITVASSSAQFRHLYDPSIRFLHIKGAARTREVVLTRRKNKYLTCAAQMFCDYLIQYYQEMSRHC